MASGNLYSRVVAGLKIALPLAALGILSSVVFFARESEDVREIPFLSDAGGETSTERLALPEYTALTGDGAEVILRAAQVTRDLEVSDLLHADALTGRIESPSGRIFQAAAPSGRIDIEASTALLDGVVSVDTSDGYHVLTGTLLTRLDATFAETEDGVRGDAPFGTLEAGGMRYAPDSDGADILVFNGGVKLIYQPRK